MAIKRIYSKHKTKCQKQIFKDGYKKYIFLPSPSFFNSQPVNIVNIVTQKKVTKKNCQEICLKKEKDPKSRLQ